MSWFSRCSWCRGPFNGGNFRCCTNESNELIKSSVEDLVPIPSEFEDTSGSDSKCILPSCDDFSPINIYKEKSVTFSNLIFDSNDHFTSSDDESLSDEDVPEDNMKIYSNPLFEFNDEYISSDVDPLFDEVLEDIECKDSYDSNLDESTFLVTPLLGFKFHFRRECEDMIDELKGKFNGMSIEINKKIELQRLEQVANLSTYPSQRFKSFCCDDDDDYDCEERSVPLRDSIFELPPSIAIIPVLPTLEPGDSLIMGDEELSTIPENKSDEFINDSYCDLPSCDDFSPINGSEEKSVTFSNLLFNSNDDFTSSDDESLSDEDVPEDNLEPSFEFDDKYILSDVNPLFDEDECFDPGGEIDEINAFLVMDISTDIENGYHDSEGDITYLESLLINDTIPNLPLEAFLDHDPISLMDEPYKDDLKSMVKVFDPGIHKKKFSPTYVSLSFEDRHYLSFTYVIRIFLPYFTYPVESSSLPLSSGSEDIIFDPGISAFHFSSLEPVAYEYPMEDCPDYEDSRAREIPSGESKVHIEVLSVLWGNRLPIPDGSLPLSRYQIFRKGQKQSINGRNRARDWKSARKAKPKAFFSLMEDKPNLDGIMDTTSLNFDKLELL
ncbi:hypothetical protein Tco_0658562 [Tanacetum coccineum]